MAIPIGLIIQGASLLGNAMGKKSKGGNVGKGASMGTGIAQSIVGAIQRKKADALLPPSENVMERQMLQNIRRRRRALETGTAGSADRAAIRQMGKSFGRNMFQAGGMGNFGQIAAMQSKAMQNLASTYGQQIGAQMQLEQAQSKSMADLANDLARLRSTRMSARGEANIKGGTENLLAALGGKGGDGAAAEAQSKSSKSSTRTTKNQINTETDEQIDDSAIDFN
jgi:hypothetical protein